MHGLRVQSVLTGKGWWGFWSWACDQLLTELIRKQRDLAALLSYLTHSVEGVLPALWVGLPSSADPLETSSKADTECAHNWFQIQSCWQWSLVGTVRNSSRKLLNADFGFHKSSDCANQMVAVGSGIWKGGSHRTVKCGVFASLSRWMLASFTGTGMQPVPLT